MRVSSRRFPRRLGIGVTVALVACGGGDLTQPPPPPPPPPAPVAVVAVEPSAVTLALQGTQQLTATLRDAQGNVLTGRAITWASNAETVASVSSAGLVTALAAGSARITATSEGQSANATVAVVNGIQVGPTGGTLVFDSGAVTLTVPAGAVANATVLTVSRVTNPTSVPPAGWQRIGPVYAVGPAGTSFAQPVTVTLAYQPADLPAFTMTGDVGVLHGSQGLTAVTVNTQTRKISGQTMSFAATASTAPSSGARAAGAALADEPEVAVMIHDPDVSLAPGSASVNSSHRYATFTVAVEARGAGIPLPEDTPSLLYRWRSSTAHGGLIDDAALTAWTETTSVEYLATDPDAVLSGISGEIDRVFVDVLLNPEALTDPAAGPLRIVSAEAAVDADLTLTYAVTPTRATVKQSETTDLRVVVRDKAGNEHSLGVDQTAIWATSGNHGRLAGDTTGPTVTYEAKDVLELPPPRVDRVVMVVRETRRHDAVIREKRGISDETGERHALLEAVDLVTAVERARDTAFVTAVTTNSFEGLGFQISGPTASADGSVIAGTIGTQAARWTADGGVKILTPGYAYDISADGSVVVGGNGARPFRWTAAGGIQFIADSGYAYGVSSDGTVVVGEIDRGFGILQRNAFRWTASGGLQILGASPSSARAVSADGAVVVGHSNEAVRWTGGTLAVLGNLGLDPRYSRPSSAAFDVSDDGSVVVGVSTSPSGYRVFRSAGGALQNLGAAPDDNQTEATHVSGDGSIVVIDGRLGLGGSISLGARIWTLASGMRDLKTVLVDDHGLSLTGWTLGEVWISADGRVLVGNGRNPLGVSEVWRAQLAAAPE